MGQTERLRDCLYFLRGEAYQTYFESTDTKISLGELELVGFGESKGVIVEEGSGCIKEIILLEGFYYYDSEYYCRDSLPALFGATHIAFFPQYANRNVYYYKEN